MSAKAMASSGRLLLIGAGATRGSSLGYRAECEPPLNGNFFQQLQRITTKDTALARAVMADVVELFGHGRELTLEDYFTQLEFLISTAESLDPAKGSATAADLRERRDRLMAALSATLEASTSQAIGGRNSRGCDLHRAIARELVVGDTIISFNYDCVMDHALSAECGGVWEASVGYGFPAGVKVVGADFWSPGKPLTVPSETIRLLKLHGSLNWQLPRGPRSELRLKQRLHRQNGTPRFDIVPPEWNKTIRNNAVLAGLGRDAFEAITQAERIAVIGFSFAPTDLHAESLFRLGLEGRSIETLVIANPSGSDRARIRSIFGPALARGRGVVREYESLEKMAATWPACINR